MLKSINEDTALKFKNLSAEDKNEKGILGRLYGPVASCFKPTRNGRKYSERLWEKLFESDLTKERFYNGGIFGQLCHPDYEEVDMEKVACIMPEQPVKDKDGKLIAYIDILNTPCGKIAYQLAKYGYKFGISSRGTGDLIDGPDGEEVDPETYQLNAFDLVEIPAVAEARLSFVESLDTKKNNKTLRETLTESINKASDEEKVIMNEALDTLGIDLKEADVSGWEQSDIDLYNSTDWKNRNYTELPVPEDNFESEITIYRAGEKPETKTVKFIKYIRPNNIFPPYYGPEEEIPGVLGPMFDGHKHGVYDIHDRYEDQKIYDRLSESINESKKVYTVAEYYRGEDGSVFGAVIDNSDIDKYGEGKKYTFTSAEEKEKLINDFNDKGYINYQGYSRVNEECNSENCSDKESVNDNEVVNDKSDNELVAEFSESLKQVQELRKDNISLQEKLSVCTAKEIELEAQLAKYKQAAAALSESSKKVKPLTKSLNESEKLSRESTEKVKQLTEKLQEVKRQSDNSAASKEEVKQLTEKLNLYSKQLEDQKQLVENYRKSYKALKDSYLSVKASSCGLNKADVLQKLGESYKIKDIDLKCDELSRLKRNMNKLPFSINEGAKISISSERKLSQNQTISDDYVSDSLLHMADIN